MGGKSVNIDYKFQLKKIRIANPLFHTYIMVRQGLYFESFLGRPFTLAVGLDGRPAHIRVVADTYNNADADDDWISRLPDDILVGILSSLPLKEAARTSILSLRWENLWKHTSHLNFYAHSALDKIAKHHGETHILTQERRKYINLVSKVLRSHKGLALKEVRICFDLDKSAHKAINYWLQIVFARQVERLELDLSCYGDFGRRLNVYALNKLQRHTHLDSFNCPLLEHLVIDYALKISNLNICGALALKHLEIRFCFRVKSIKVSAPNLISLKVTSVEALLLENVPKLVEVYVCCGPEDVYAHKLVPALHCCLSQLEILMLDLSIKTKFIEDCKFPVLPNLKKLAIEFFGRRDESLIGLTSFIRAAPYIQEFVIKVRWYKLLRTDRNVKNAIHSPHQHLKVVKFLGYYGRSSDVELVRYLMDNCVVLEKIIIDPRYQSNYLHRPMDPGEVDGLVDDDITLGIPTTLVYPAEFDGLEADEVYLNVDENEVYLDIVGVRNDRCFRTGFKRAQTHSRISQLARFDEMVARAHEAQSLMDAQSTVN
ncbi:putative F-box/FBD/LRR-repeat protein at1g66290 [Phtheirospermum japonicum]|uniref:Putative F-box/FBD/LRR-repeat protein at1g66290 n=1 Tax=Phtheirospermum japonicum TaxID=374723 RepID=A0A830CFJ9_9LAMI|nr:putative F-box/FBD/LRR-repeat protein at1g66290 [Phtheirospermum japonicum]